jgi:hypothetical protein
MTDILASGDPSRESYAAFQGISILVARRVRIPRTERTMAMKKYLRKRVDWTEDWVTNPKDATADYRKAAEVTQVRLAILGVRDTTLVEVPDAHQMESRYIICREEQTLPS